MAADPKDPPRHHYTLEEYFALERRGDARYEYWDGEIVSMSGGSKQHGRIAGNVYFGLRQRMAGRGCEVFNSEIPMKTPPLPPCRYPDASLVCGEAVFESVDGIDTLDYLMLAQNTPHATLFSRQGDNWIHSDYGDLTPSIVLTSIECSLSLSEVYAAVQFE